jgi:hypothetical protein
VSVTLLLLCRQLLSINLNWKFSCYEPRTLTGYYDVTQSSTSTLCSLSSVTLAALTWGHICSVNTERRTPAGHLLLMGVFEAKADRASEWGDYVTVWWGLDYICCDAGCVYIRYVIHVSTCVTWYVSMYDSWYRICLHTLRDTCAYVCYVISNLSTYVTWYLCLRRLRDACGYIRNVIHVSTYATWYIISLHTSRDARVYMLRCTELSTYVTWYMCVLVWYWMCLRILIHNVAVVTWYQVCLHILSYRECTYFDWYRLCLLVLRDTECVYIQGGSNMTGTNYDLFTHKSSWSYLNHLVYWYLTCLHIWSDTECVYICWYLTCLHIWSYTQCVYICHVLSSLIPFYAPPQCLNSYFFRITMAWSAEHLNFTFLGYSYTLSIFCGFKNLKL